MRIHSTTESVKAGEFTWLAIAECALSTALYLAIAHHLHTFHYYALAIALAPLALLRTDAAAEWALQRYQNTNGMGQRLLNQWGYYDKRHPVFFVPSMVFVYSVTIAWGLVYRIVSVTYWFFRQPIEAIRKMPSNWLRQALCVDLYAPPEIVPGEDAYKLEWEITDYSGRTRNVPLGASIITFRRVFLGAEDPAVEWQEKELGLKLTAEDPRDWRLVMLRSAFILLLFFPAYLVPLLYRISLKATCLVYAPFVWVAGATAGSADTLKVRLERIVKGEFEKSRRGFAKLVLFIAVVKFALNFGWIGSTEAAHEVLIGSEKLVDKFLEPKSWPWWHIALVCSGLLTPFSLASIFKRKVIMRVWLPMSSPQSRLFVQPRPSLSLPTLWRWRSRRLLQITSLR